MSDKTDFEFQLLRGRKIIFYFTLLVAVIVNLVDIVRLDGIDKHVFALNVVSIIVFSGVSLFFLWKKLSIAIAYLFVVGTILLNSIISLYLSIDIITSAVVMREIFFIGLVITLSALLIHRNVSYILSLVYIVNLLIINNLLQDHFLNENIFLLIFSLLMYSIVITFFVGVLEKTIKNLNRNNIEIEAKNVEITLQNEELKTYQEEIIAQRNTIEEHFHLLKETNEDLEKIKIALEESNGSKDKLFSIIAHDIKNPLFTIKGFTDLLYKRFSVIDEEKKLLYVSNISGSINKLNQLIENLLFWAKAQMNRIEVNTKQITLFEVVQEAYKISEQRISQKKINFRNFVYSNVIVSADENMLLLIIRNLLVNATKFTPEGGNISIAAMKKEHMIIVSVSDTGEGISKDKLTTLFDLNINKSTRGTDGEIGSGLGLMLCKEFVELNKGKIWAESQKGEGTVFYFSLPEVRS